MATESLRLRRRPVPTHALPPGVHPVLSRVLAAREVRDARGMDLSLRHLLAPDGLKGMPAAVNLLLQAIDGDWRIVIAGDYDCDGATGVALAVLGLRALGAAEVDYVVPNRVTMGYGLSPQLAQQAAALGARLLLTVDNGIASLEGVAQAQSLGLRVLVTDHHLPGPALPAADALVNPNQPGCTFGSPHLAGVGVLFYLLLALRAALRRRGAWATTAEPDLRVFLDLVALGTVADLVRLDTNNRTLVAAGLQVIRAGGGRPGIHALMQVAGRDARRASAVDLGFAVGPRINAAGRLEDIRIGIRCLLADTPEQALPLAVELDHINRARRELQAQMSEQAQLQWRQSECGHGHGIALFDPEWHEGVVGLIASRLREAANRPAVAFARAQAPGMLKGSARSVPGLHLRDVLARIDTQAPGLIERFGGHAMAAGLSLPEQHLAAFQQAFDGICREQLRPEQLERVLETDGPLSATELSLSTAQVLEAAGPWGQGMPEPVFDNDFEVIDARCVGSDQNHVRYRLRGDDGSVRVAMHFHGAQTRQSQGRVHVAYALAIDHWRQCQSLQLRVLDLQPCEPATPPAKVGDA